MTNAHRRLKHAVWGVAAMLVMLSCAMPARADGKLIRPRNYQGSLEENSQEAIIIFHSSDQPDGAFEELIPSCAKRGAAPSSFWLRLAS